MNPEIGSIMGFMYKVFPARVYETRIPEEFAVPALYFPPPTSFGSNDTNQTYLKTYSLSVKLFHEDSQQAYEAAESITDEIHDLRNAIPILSPDGVPTGDFINVTRAEARVGDSGVAVIVLTWDSRYYYRSEAEQPLKHVEIKSGVIKQ